MPMYGDKSCSAPNLSKLAESGLVFMNAYANAPVCAVARSTILTGVNEATLGTHNMRSRYPVPPKFKPYPVYFKEAGYYCTNAAKTDYNIRMNDASIWDECRRTAHFKNRPSKDTPFLAVFNIETTHESNLFDEKIARNRARNIIPPIPENDPERVDIPGYLPPLPEIKSDIAVYYDCIKAMDRRVGEIISDLMREPREVVDNTIIFYYSDHGGILPRQKRNLNKDGTQVPLIVYIPEKLKHLNPFGRTGKISERTVDFTDLAPTILNLAGIKIPEQMCGKPFLGMDISGKSDEVFLVAARFDESTYFSRAVSSGNVRYIRNFFAYRQPLIVSNYAFGQAGWRAFRRAAVESDSPALECAYWWKPQGAHFLYDTASDPDETKNLAYGKSHGKLLKDMKNRLKKAMLESRDLGVIPEFAYDEILKKHSTVYDFARSSECGYEKVFEAAWTASECDKADEKKIRKMVESGNPFIRYWGSVGLLNLKLADVDAELQKLMSDSRDYNRAMAYLIIANNLGRKDEALKGFASLLDFKNASQTQATRRFLISQVALLGVDSKEIARLEAENGDS